MGETRLVNVKSALGLDSHPLAFMQINSPNVSKKSFVNLAAECALSHARKNNAVVSRGLSSGFSEPEKKLQAEDGSTNSLL
ncbi:MAG: hypothetical protein ACRECH_12980 [Nitrososphaerales archaeon]